MKKCKIPLNIKSLEKYKYFDNDYGMERYNIDQINEDLKQPLLLLTTKYEKEILKMLRKF